jgi:hypothetical protein
MGTLRSMLNNNDFILMQDVSLLTRTINVLPFRHPSEEGIFFDRTNVRCFGLAGTLEVQSR